MADKTTDLASKVPGGEGIVAKIDDVTRKIPGMGDAQAAVEEATDEATEQCSTQKAPDLPPRFGVSGFCTPTPQQLACAFRPTGPQRLGQSASGGRR